MRLRLLLQPWPWAVYNNFSDIAASKPVELLLSLCREEAEQQLVVFDVYGPSSQDRRGHNHAEDQSK